MPLTAGAPSRRLRRAGRPPRPSHGSAPRDAAVWSGPSNSVVCADDEGNKAGAPASLRCASRQAAAISPPCGAPPSPRLGGKCAPGRAATGPDRTVAPTGVTDRRPAAAADVFPGTAAFGPCRREASRAAGAARATSPRRRPTVDRRRGERPARRRRATPQRSRAPARSPRRSIATAAQRRAAIAANASCSAGWAGSARRRTGKSVPSIRATVPSAS